MGSREAGQSGIGFDCDGGSNHRGLPAPQSSRYFPDGPGVVFVPGAHRSDKTVRLKQKCRHEHSAAGRTLGPNHAASLLHDVSLQRLDTGLRDSDKQGTLADQLYWKRRRFDLNSPIFETYFQWGTRPEAGFMSHGFGDDQTTGRIDGSLHGTHSTTRFA